MKVMMLQDRAIAPQDAGAQDAGAKTLVKGTVHDLPDALAVFLLSEGAALPARDRQPSLPDAGQTAPRTAPDALGQEPAGDEPADAEPGDPKAQRRKR